MTAAVGPPEDCQPPLSKTHGGFIPTYPAPTQQMFLICVVPEISEDNIGGINRLVSLELVRSSSIPSEVLKGLRTGLNERLPSGVVGAVELSRAMFSSSSAAGGT